MPAVDVIVRQTFSTTRFVRKIYILTARCKMQTYSQYSTLHTIQIVWRRSFLFTRALVIC